MSDEAARALLREWAVCTRFHTRKLCFEHVTNCMCRRTFAAALAAEREAGWQAGVEAAVPVIEAARAMPRRTPGPGGASTVHTFAVEASAVWALDVALSEYDKARALPYPAPEPQAAGHTDLMAFMEANPLSQEPTGSGQPDEAVVARARRQVEDADHRNDVMARRGMPPVADPDGGIARALLAALARAEAVERERDVWKKTMEGLLSGTLGEQLHKVQRCEAAEQRERALREALEDISQSGPVDQHGEPDPYAGWSWCYERARAALEASR